MQKILKCDKIEQKTMFTLVVIALYLLLQLLETTAIIKSNTQEMLCENFYSQSQKIKCYQTLITIPNNHWREKKVHFKIRFVVDDVGEDGIYLKYVTENKTILTLEVVDATCSDQLRIKQIDFQGRIVCTTNFTNKVEVINTVDMRINHQYTLLQHDIQQDEDIVRLPSAIKNYNIDYLTATTAPCGISNANNSSDSRVESGEFPWIVAIYQSSLLCVGTIISERYVITSAQPVLAKSPFDLRIFYGSSNLGDFDAKNANFLRVKNVFIHDNYSASSGSAHDIAILQVMQDIQLNVSVGSICLPLAVAFELNSNRYLAAGWTSLAFTVFRYYNPIPDKTLHKIDTSISSPAECAKERFISASDVPRGTFCNDGGLCSCISGSPLFQLVNSSKGNSYYVLKGILSKLHPEYSEWNPGPYREVYVDVESELDWIRSIPKKSGR